MQILQMKKNRNDVIKTIQEIAKVDEFTINQAIEACQDNEGRYSMDQVLNILMDEVSHLNTYIHWALYFYFIYYFFERTQSGSKINKTKKYLLFVIR